MSDKCLENIQYIFVDNKVMQCFKKTNELKVYEYLMIYQEKSKYDLRFFFDLRFSVMFHIITDIKHVSG